MENPMYKKLLLSAISLLISSQTIAQSYQFEGALNLVQTQTSFEDEDEEADSATVSGTYYFTPVPSTKHLFQEAAFLERKSSVSLSYIRGQSDSSDTDIDTDSLSTTTYKTKEKDIGSNIIISAETFLFNDILYIGAYAVESRNTTNTTETVSSSDSPDIFTDVERDKTSDDDWRLNLGAAPVKGLLVWTDLHKDASKNSSVNINAKYVLEFANSGLNLQAGYSKNAIANVFAPNVFAPNVVPSNIRSIYTTMEDLDLTSIYFLSDYYFTKTFSLGLGITHTNVDSYTDEDGVEYEFSEGDYEIDDTYMIRVKKFFGESFSAQLFYMQNDIQDIYSLGIAKRF